MIENLPPDFEGLNSEEIRKEAIRELKALKKEEKSQIEEIKKMSYESKGKVTLKEIVNMLVKRTSTFFAERKDPDFAYRFFKVYYDETSSKFKKKDIKEIRENMLIIGRKLYDLHNQKAASLEEKNE